MKFWKELISNIKHIPNVITTASFKIIEALNSIESKLIKDENYVANENPIKKINSSTTLVMACNDERNKIIIQNIGLEPCYIKLDSEISKDNFHFVLAPDTSPAYGNGGSITLDNWHGKVYAICEKETKLSILEY